MQIELSKLKLKEISIIPDTLFEKKEIYLRKCYQKLVDDNFEDYFDNETLEEIEEIYKKYEDKDFLNLGEIEDANDRLDDLLSDLRGLIEKDKYDCPTIYDYEPHGDTYEKRAI
jgi:hypothetical protein